MPKYHNVAIARSGVQYYMRDELVGMGLTSIPREFNHLSVFGVYRPALQIQKHAKDYTNKGVVIGHERWISGLDDPAVIGTTSDEVSTKMYGNEVELHGKVALFDENYDIKDQPVSPGYKAKYVWNSGVTADGVEFQVVMKEILAVNHLAFVPKGRGGDHIKVLDGGGHVAKPRKILSGLLRYAKKAAHGVNDADMGSFRNTIDDIVENRTRWTSEEMDEHCNTLMVFTQDLPDSEEKDKLLRFIADIPLIVGEDDETAKQVGDAISALYEQLDSDAMSDVVSQGGTEVPEPTDMPVTATEDTAMVPSDAAPAAPAAAPSTASAETSEASADYILKEIFLLLKKKFEGSEPAPAAHAEPDGDEPVAVDTAPAPAAPAAPASAPAPAVKEDKDDYTGDALPMYSQTLQTHTKTASLDEAFTAMKKKGGR